MAAVRRYDILDTPPDGAFDRVTALAARHFEVPISIVSIIDNDRIWFKSRHGVEVDEVGRDPGLCASAILQDDPWVITDAGVDPRALANPLVAGELGLRFYAGVPLTTGDGFNLGTLCVIDRQPREFTAEQREALRAMAAIVMDEIELRLAARTVVEREHALREQAERVAGTLQASLLPPELPRPAGVDLAAFYRPASASEVGGDFYDVFMHADGSWSLMIGDVSGKGPEAAAVTALVRYTARTAALSDSTPEEILTTVNRAMLSFRERRAERFCTLLIARVTAADHGVSARVASAGHPPALLVRPDGAMQEVGGVEVLAGLYDDAGYVSQHVELGDGDLLVLYTDGVSEVRQPPRIISPEEIAATAHQARARSAQAVADHLERELLAEAARRDDAAVMVVKFGSRQT